MKKLIIFIVLLMTIGCSGMNHQITGKVGWDTLESRHTFIGSEVLDREWDDWFIGAEYGLFGDHIGLTFHGSKKKDVDVKMFEPNWRYKAKLITFECIPEYRFHLTPEVDLKLGAGASWSRLKNTYGKTSGETLDGIGWVGLVRIDWFLDKDKRWAICPEIKYVRNDFASTVYRKTNFRVGGGKFAIALEYNWYAD